MRVFYGKNSSRNIVSALMMREMHGIRSIPNVTAPGLYSFCKLRESKVAHAAAIYCLTFDVSGQFVFTSGLDRCVKIWRASDWMLMGILRRARDTVSFIVVNNTNTVVAASSCDRSISFWNMQTCLPVAFLENHPGLINGMEFVPGPWSRLGERYLATVADNGMVFLWKYFDLPGQNIYFEQKPLIIKEQTKPETRAVIKCIAFSTGGTFMLTGGEDTYVCVYDMLNVNGPTKIMEASRHCNEVIDVKWAHDSLKFISSSHDGTLLVWKLKSDAFEYIRLVCGSNKKSSEKKQHTLSKTIAFAWNCNNDTIITANLNKLVRLWRVYDSKKEMTGTLMNTLDCFKLPVYIIFCHPNNPNVFCTAADDGKLVIWGIFEPIGEEEEFETRKMFQYSNNTVMFLAETQINPIEEVAWAPDGSLIILADSRGSISIFATIKDTNFKPLPAEMFYDTELLQATWNPRLCTFVDNETLLEIHRIPQTYLVNMEGKLHSNELQLKVPRKGLDGLPLQDIVTRLDRLTITKINHECQKAKAKEREIFKQRLPKTGAEVAEPQKTDQAFVVCLDKQGKVKWLKIQTSIASQQTGPVENDKQLPSQLRAEYIPRQYVRASRIVNLFPESEEEIPNIQASTTTTTETAVLSNPNIPGTSSGVSEPYFPPEMLNNDSDSD